MMLISHCTHAPLPQLLNEVIDEAAEERERATAARQQRQVRGGAHVFAAPVQAASK